jgi:hypothetical protein
MTSAAQRLCAYIILPAMAWLGETVEAASGPSPALRSVKDVIEERLSSAAATCLPISQWCSLLTQGPAVSGNRRTSIRDGSDADPSAPEQEDGG